MRRAVWQTTGATLLALLSGGRMAGQTPTVDPYSLSMVQSACGAEGGSPPQSMSSGYGEHAALRPEMARVYVITETRGLLGSLGEPVRLGMDGRWFSTNQSHVYDYSYVDVNPGVHHLCVASTMKGVLPHTSAGIVLTRVEAAAGNTYFFYSQCIHLAHILTLRSMSPEEGAMYLQALPLSKIPELWNTTAAQAACGANPDKMPNGPPPAPKLPGSPAEGQALVYFFSGVPQFGIHKWSDWLLPTPRSTGFVAPIHVGADGQWIGEVQADSYVGVQMAPGNHRLCSVTRWVPGMKPTLHLSRIDLVAGKTYFVDTNTLQPVEHGLAVRWLRRIAAMPKSDQPDLKALEQWSRTNFPASDDELHACGIPPADSTVEAPSPSHPDSARSTSQVIFLLKSDIKRLHRRHAVDVGLDGDWVASLRTTSWVSLPVAAGQHNVCVHIGNGPGRRDYWFSPDSTLFLDSVDAVGSTSIYFESQLTVDAIDLFWSGRLDPDEGALLVAYYPHSNTLQASRGSANGQAAKSFASATRQPHYARSSAVFQSRLW